MTPDTSPPWWAVATTTPPPEWTDRDRWEAMSPTERMAAWTEYRNSQPKEHR